MIYTVSKKLLIITSIISLLFIFGCNKKPQTTITTVEQNIETTTGDIENQTGTKQNDSTGIKTDTLLTDTGDIKALIEEYKAKNTGSKEWNKNDVDLMEKIIEKIEKK